MQRAAFSLETDGPRPELLILGAYPLPDNGDGSWDGAFGLLGEYYHGGCDDEGNVLPLSRGSYCWASANLSRTKDFFHGTGSYGYRMSGDESHGGHPQPASDAQVLSFWNAAGNAVQWHPKKGGRK